MSDINIHKLKKQDEESFQQLVEDYQQRFLTMAYKYTNHYTDAEDLCQEIFVKVYKALPAFREDSGLSTWLYRIAVNRCLDWKRKQGTGLRGLLQVKEMLMGTNPECSAEEEVLYKERQQLIHQAVYGLKDKYKTIIILYHFNGLSYKEISDILKLPVKTIETRLYRGRKQVKERLIRQGYGGECIEARGI